MENGFNKYRWQVGAFLQATPISQDTNWDLNGDEPKDPPDQVPSGQPPAGLSRAKHRLDTSLAGVEAAPPRCRLRQGPGMNADFCRIFGGHPCTFLALTVLIGSYVALPAGLCG